MVVFGSLSRDEQRGICFQLRSTIVLALFSKTLNIGQMFYPPQLAVCTGRHGFADSFLWLLVRGNDGYKGSTAEDSCHWTDILDVMVLLLLMLHRAGTECVDFGRWLTNGDLALL